jgi:hypothetical protein
MLTTCSSLHQALNVYDRRGILSPITLARAWCISQLETKLNGGRATRKLSFSSLLQCIKAWQTEVSIEKVVDSLSESPNQTAQVFANIAVSEIFLFAQPEKREGEDHDFAEWISGFNDADDDYYNAISQLWEEELYGLTESPCNCHSEFGRDDDHEVRHWGLKCPFNE